MRIGDTIIYLFLCLLGIGVLYFIVIHFDAIFYTLLTYALGGGISIFGLFIGTKFIDKNENCFGIILAIIIWLFFTWLAILLLGQIVPTRYLDAILG